MYREEPRKEAMRRTEWNLKCFGGRYVSPQEWNGNRTLVPTEETFLVMIERNDEYPVEFTKRRQHRNKGRCAVVPLRCSGRGGWMEEEREKGLDEMVFGSTWPFLTKVTKKV